MINEIVIIFLIYIEYTNHGFADSVIRDLKSVRYFIITLKSNK